MHARGYEMKISEQRLTNEAAEPFVHNRLGRRTAR